MGAPFFNILQKTDNALVAYVISAGAGTADDVFPAKRSLTKTLPCTICESKSAKPVGNNMSGLYEVDCSVYVRTQGSLEDEDNLAGTPADDSADRVAKTCDIFNTNLDQAGDMLADLINAAASGLVTDFKVQDAQINEIRAGFEAKGDAWVDIIDLKLVVCPNDDATA